MQVIGFVTQPSSERMPESFRDDESVLVYLPLSYMIGGYAVLIPRSAIRPLDMTIEEAMRFTLTAGMTGSGFDHSTAPRPESRPEPGPETGKHADNSPDTPTQQSQKE